MLDLRDPNLWAHRAWSERGSAAAYRAFADAARGTIAAEHADAFREAAADESAHATLCAKLAERLGGRAPVGAPPSSPTPRSEDELVAEVAAMCCIGETLNAVLLGEEVRATDDDDVRAVLTTLLRDEVRHARIGWALLGRAVVTSDPQRYSRALQAALDDARARAQQGSIGISTAATRSLLHAAIAEVVVPGFARCGITLALGCERRYAPRA